MLSTKMFPFDLVKVKQQQNSSSFLFSVERWIESLRFSVVRIYMDIYLPTGLLSVTPICLCYLCMDLAVQRYFMWVV